ncbi:MAG: hypothetical protein K2W97_03020 [Chthoniobacterales bacterium]|nr:hypothetical protein [Chthoniobacterales bacterium]
MRPEFSNITEQPFFLSSSGDAKKKEPLPFEKTEKINSSHLDIIRDIARAIYPKKSIEAASEKFSGSDSLSASPTVKESMKITVPFHHDLEEDQTTVSSRSQAASPSSSTISELSGSEISSKASSPKSPKEVRYQKMLTAAHATEIDAEYAKLCEHWKGVNSKLENKGYYNVASDLLERLAEQLSTQPDSSLEEGLVQANKGVSDFAKQNKTANQPAFDQKLRKEYQQVHATFQKALQQYLVSKEIAELRLLHASPKEEGLLVDFLGEKKATLDQAMISLEKIKQTIKEDNHQKSIESLRNAYPEAATLEEAREQWMNDLPNGI